MDAVIGGIGGTLLLAGALIMLRNKRREPQAHKPRLQDPLLGGRGAELSPTTSWSKPPQFVPPMALGGAAAGAAVGVGSGYMAPPMVSPGGAATAAGGGPPLLVVLAGQRSADLASICRALQGAGVPTAAGQSSAEFAELAMSDAELVHPERDARLAGLLRSGRLREGHAGGPACVVLAFDSAGERLPLLGQYGKLEKLHAALLRAGVPAQRIAFAGTREARPEADIFAPGGLSTGFVQRLGNGQLAELRRNGYVGGTAARFMLWGREATALQMSTLSAWLGTVRTDPQEAAMLQELTGREEEALENMINNMRAIKAVATAAKAAGDQQQQQSGAGAAKAASPMKQQQQKKSKRAQNVQWADGV